MKFKFLLITAFICLSPPVLPMSASLDKPTDLDRLYDKIQSYCKTNKKINSVRVTVDLDKTEIYSNVGSVNVRCNNSGNLGALIENDGQIKLYKDSKNPNTPVVDRKSKKLGNTLVNLVRSSVSSKLITNNLEYNISRDPNTQKIVIKIGAFIS